MCASLVSHADLTHVIRSGLSRLCEDERWGEHGPTSQPGVRPRPGPSRLAMSSAHRLPLLAPAPASPRALQSSCSCNRGRQLLGDMLLGAACICASGILNAGPRLPWLCALHDAALLVCACRLPVGARARPVCTCTCGAARRSASRSCFSKRLFVCGCVLPHLVMHFTAVVFPAHGFSVLASGV